MKEQAGKQWVVTGRVQGVWFRASTKEAAEKIGVTGWVRNLPDGQVEVMAYGSAAQLAELHEWLKHGPRLANVTELTDQEIAWEEMADFSIR